MAKKINKLGLYALCCVQFLSCSTDTSLQQNEVQVENDEQIISIEEPVISIEDSQPTPPIGSDNADENEISCNTSGGFANETGLKSWCWQDAVIPNYTEKKGVAFSNGYLHVDSECYEKQVTIENDRIKFSINPSYPVPDSWCARDYNMRAEIRTAPWDVRHELGTEEWFGWTYSFGDNYVIDHNSQWKFFQVHNGVTGQSPQIGLEIINANQFKEHEAGEIYVTVAGDKNNYTPTGVTPLAGQTLEIVVHVIYGDAQNGLLKVWINNSLVFNQNVSTVLNIYPWGGNAKWGIYKWPWASKEGVEKSIEQGIDYLNTYMGNLRIITRIPSDTNYGKNSYSLVAPN